jgi:DNA-binding CsgD family transcriptional regulator
MNTHPDTLTRVEAQRTIAHRRGERPLRSVGEFFEAAERQTSRGMLLPDRGRSLEQWVAVLRAAMHPEDVERLRADAELAVEQLAPGSYFRSAALHVLEVAHLLAGNDGSLDATAGQVKKRSDGEDPEAIRFRMRLAASLTPAELRLLPLLATHLSLREIGERLYISRNTVKTEAISAYHKLCASSRSEAVRHAAELGLIEGTAATGACGLVRSSAVTQEQLSQLALVVVALADGGLTSPSEATA